LNGDGKLDLAGANKGDTGHPGAIVMLGNGDGTFQQSVAYQAGSSPFGIAVGDFNLDGVPDLAVTNYAGTRSSMSLLLGNGDGTFQAFTNYVTGSSPAGIVIGDFNNDNALDVASANSELGDAGNGTVSVLLNTAGTQVTATSSPNPSQQGQAVTLTVTI